jgi:hypothetical protein
MQINLLVWQIPAKTSPFMQGKVLKSKNHAGEMLFSFPLNRVNIG